MIDAMKLELNLPHINHRMEEVNLLTVIKHIRNRGGQELLCNINNVRPFHRQGKRGYMRHLVNLLQNYNLIEHRKHGNKTKNPPPWKDKKIEVNIIKLSRKKSDCEKKDLKAIFEKHINTMIGEN